LNPDALCRNLAQFFNSMMSITNYSSPLTNS
jgi:hypothetical protein